MEIYNEFSKVYDHFMEDIPYNQWGEFIREQLLAYGIQKSRATCDSGDNEPAKPPLLLDLGCGTGAMTERLASYGYELIGIDNSTAMLEIAKNKEESSPHNILYLLQDMREFELYGSVTAVVCVCDSINYILEIDELKQVFRLVNHYLDPGGLFLFDFNTDYKYRKVIGNQTIAENREDKSFIWENYYYEEERINEIELSLFVKENQGVLYRKYIEIHHQRAYHLDEIREALEETGLELIKAYDDYTDGEVHQESQRVVVVAKLRLKTGVVK